MTAPAQQRLAADPAVMLTWLTHVYGGQPGLISICSDADKWVGRRFTTDPAGLKAAVAYAVKLDQRQPKGVYTQVTTLSEDPAKGRGGEDLVLALTHLWSDGDFGTIGHKPGLDDLPAPPDEDAVRKVVAESGLPEPSGWTHSGGGLNGVWMLAEPRVLGDGDDRAAVKDVTMTWQAILAAQAYRCGWSWDTEVGNKDRLMKLPGSINRKEGLERPATIGPGTGLLYDFAHLASIATELGPAARETLAIAAQERQARRNQRLGVATLPPRPPSPRVSRPVGAEGPLGILAEMLSPQEILEAQGFTYRGQLSDGRMKYLRPTASGDAPSSEYSLLVDDHVAVNFSERSGLPTGALPSGSKLTAANLYAHFHYAGNASEAARDILRAAAGRECHGAAGRLPVTVLEEVRRRCIREDISRSRAAHSMADEDPWAGPLDEPTDLVDPGADARSGNRLPGLLPEEFYAARGEHQHIRQAGHSRNRSGDVAVLATLVRLSGLVSHHIRADTGLAGLASLNLFGGIIGPSGIGKSTGVEVGAMLTPAPPGLDFRDNLPIGSGEGIAEVFIDTVEEDTGEVSSRGKPIMKTVRKQVRHNAGFYVDEGASLTRLMKERSGSTLGETLRSAAVGQTLGQTNASKDTSRYIPKGSYSMGLLVGFQPETVAPLFDEIGEGTPQRFLWLQVIDPSIPDEQPDWPGELTGWRVAVDAEAPMPVTFDDEIKAELRRADLAKARGEVSVADLNPLDSHAPLMRVKVASLLAILTGRLHVTPEDWRLAEMVWQASCETRDAVLRQIQQVRREEQERRTQARIIEEVRVDEAKVSAEQQRADKAVLRIATRIAMHLREGEALTRSALRDKIAGRDKKHVNEAIAYALLREWVVERDGRLARGPIEPS